MNCIIIDDDIISRKLIESYVEKTDFLTLQSSFSNPVEALPFISANNIDLIFLDIEMPEMTGIELLETIRQKMPQIILNTSHKEFALEAFEYNVTDYLVKPIGYPRFYKAVEKAKNIFETQNIHYINDDTVFVKNGTSIVRLNKSDIIWVEALGDYVVLNTEKDKIIVHSTMSAMEAKLPTKNYIRVHRSYIVRIDKIDSIEDNAISYKEKIIPIGKSYKESVLKRLNTF